MTEVRDQRSGVSKSHARSARLFALCCLVALLLALCFSAEAQQPKKVPRIGYLSNSSGNRQPEEGFQKGLRERGYIEGQNIFIEWRFSKGKLDLLPEFAAELVRLNLDCLVTSGILATRAAQKATNTIPIVMTNASDDPVRQGLITSLARPGGNITGVIDIASELAGKRLELMKEAFPKISRVVHLSDKNSPSGAAHVKEAAAAARVLVLRFQPVEVQGASDLENAFEAVNKERP